LDKATVTPTDRGVGVQNEGKIFVKHKYRFGEGTEYRDLDVKEKYIGTENSVLRYENGARTLCADYVNHGVLYSPTRFRIVQHGTVTKWGKAVAEDGIEYEIDGGPFNLTGELIRPVVNGHNKHNIVEKLNILDIFSL
jgi:hypothetical protein